MVPSGNEGRGYVLRRLLRRAVMHGRRLGISDAFCAKLVPTVIKSWKAITQKFWEERWREEQQNVKKKPLHVPSMAGSSIFNLLLANLKKSGKDTLEGKDIFKLYDTYGFPVKSYARAPKMRFKIDHGGFKAAWSGTTRTCGAMVKGGSKGMQNETPANITEPSGSCKKLKLPKAVWA